MLDPSMLPYVVFFVTTVCVEVDARLEHRKAEQQQA